MNFCNLLKPPFHGREQGSNRKEKLLLLCPTSKICLSYRTKRIAKWMHLYSSKSGCIFGHGYILADEKAERVVHPTGGRRMRRRPAAASSSTASSSAQEARVESDEEVPEDDYYVAKASSKKEKKKQEREAQRQAEEAARESRKTKQDRYAEMRRRKDEDREAQERLEEEEALARKAKEEEAAALEFEKWKGDFSVDAEGTTESDIHDEAQGLLSSFVEYIKKQKCVPLEDLAAEFKLRTQDCINRIITLESMGRLSGVMDDRGKYIYISPEEMKAVAEYIKRQGRVNISHLATKSNEFIDLDPKPQFDVELSTDGITVA